MIAAFTPSNTVAPSDSMQNHINEVRLCFEFPLKIYPQASYYFFTAFIKLIRFVTTTGTASSAPTEEVLVSSGGDFPAPFTK